MGSKVTRRNAVRTRARSIERLEDRQVMSADPTGGLLGLPIQQHGFEDTSSLVHATEPNADFWIDSWLERDVESLVGDVQQTLASAHNSTGLTAVRNDYGFTGAGQTVAVIDSGIAWSHSALGGGLGVDYRVVGGWDFTENDADPYDDGPWGSHGTHVAGIVGADATGANYDGVATGVDLVALRVFDDAGAGYFHWVENALQWVHQNRNAFANPITAVNLSLGTSWNSNTIPSWTTLEDEFAQLKADGIFIAVSAGNAFATYNTPGLSYPAASPHVVPVMSVMDNGSLSSFSQRHTRAIAAPGQYIVSTIPDYVGNNNGVNDDFASYSGTSMAAPYVAGASVLLRQAMQFVGYTNITQDTIYNHLMATATSFIDAATGQTYKRINLTNAFNTLMPTDEYGSTVATAHDLGTLSGVSEVSGLIGKLSDADFFRFTAAANGTVTFTATTTHGLAPVWTASGGTVSGSDGETYTFDVVAGQSYTIGVSTSGGTGYYDLAIKAESVFTYADWGTITQSQSNNIANAGERWYRVTASRAGHFTTEALFAIAGGDIDLAIYDSNMQLLASGTANAAGERVDFLATADASYFVRVTGVNAEIDFRLTNLVSQSGATVTVAGTSANDTFTFGVGATHHAVSVNGVAYQFHRASVSTINTAGGAGNDAITMTGSTANDTATLRFAYAELAGAGYTATVSNIETITIHGGGGTGDVANLYDTAGNDTYTSWWNRAVMYGDGYWNDVRGFDSTYAYASQGSDRAVLRDSAGDDVFTTWWNRAVMYGNGYWNDARGFDSTIGMASQGDDRAMLRDSSSNDAFQAWSNRASMTGARYSNDARDFDRTFGFASDGNDRVDLYLTPGTDECTISTDRVVVTGAGFCNDARGFDSMNQYSTLGANRLSSYNVAGNSLRTSWIDQAIMSAASYSSSRGSRRADDRMATDGLSSNRVQHSARREEFEALIWNAGVADHTTWSDVEELEKECDFAEDEGDNFAYFDAIHEALDLLGTELHGAE
jgi:subtilisin family serine protease